MLLALILAGFIGFGVGTQIKECPSCDVVSVPIEGEVEAAFAAVEQVAQPTKSKYKPKPGRTPVKGVPKRTCVERKLINVCGKWAEVK